MRAGAVCVLPVHHMLKLRADYLLSEGQKADNTFIDAAVRTEVRHLITLASTLKIVTC